MVFELLVTLLATAVFISLFLFGYMKANAVEIETIIGASKTAFKDSIVPIVTSDGDIIDSPETLNAHLEALSCKLNEKEQKLYDNKAKIQNTEEKILALDSTKSEVRKFYYKLKYEIKNTENECKDLQEQINEYARKRDALKVEVRKQRQRYKDMMETVYSRSGNFENCPSINLDTSSAFDSSEKELYDNMIKECEDCDILTSLNTLQVAQTYLDEKYDKYNEKKAKVVTKIDKVKEHSKCVLKTENFFEQTMDDVESEFVFQNKLKYTADNKSHKAADALIEKEITEILNRTKPRWNTLTNQYE